MRGPRGYLHNWMLKGNRREKIPQVPYSRYLVVGEYQDEVHFTIAQLSPVLLPRMSAIVQSCDRRPKAVYP
jgi:hypothetical protein